MNNNNRALFSPSYVVRSYPNQSSYPLYQAGANTTPVRTALIPSQPMYTNQTSTPVRTVTYYTPNRQLYAAPNANCTPRNVVLQGGSPQISNSAMAVFNTPVRTTTLRQSLGTPLSPSRVTEDLKLVYRDGRPVGTITKILRFPLIEGQWPQRGLITIKNSQGKVFTVPLEGLKGNLPAYYIVK